MPCSSLTLETKNNRHFLARTMDFTFDPGSCLMILPRKQPVVLSRAGNQTNLKYAILGMGTKDPKHQTLYDGLNEAGVMGAVLYYPGAIYAKKTEQIEIPVNPLCALLYLLGNGGTLEEIKTLSAQMTLIDEENPIMGDAPPLHFIFSDRTGKTLIMEPDADGISYYEDNIGVLTNAPAYPWHETNARNYIGINPVPKSAISMDGKNMAPFGQGSGTWGLPGDFTGPSRFIRTAYTKQYAEHGDNELEGMNQCLQILSPVNIPKGVVVNAEGHTDFTRYTCAMCAESRTYYFNTYDCRRVHAASLNEKNCTADAVIRYDWPAHPDIHYFL